MTRTALAVLFACCLFFLGSFEANAQSAPPLVALHPSEVVDAAPNDAERIHALVAAELLRRGVPLAPSEKVEAFITRNGSCAERLERERSECLQNLARSVGAARAVMLSIAPWAGDKVVLTAQVVSKSGAVLQDLPPFSRPRDKSQKDIDPSVRAALAEFIPTLDLSSVENEELVAPLATSTTASATATTTEPGVKSPPQPPASASATVHSSSLRRPVGIALLVVGAAGLGAGTFGFVDASQKAARWNALHQGGTPSSADEAELASLHDGIQRSQTIGIAGVATGAVAAAVGAWLLISSGDDAPPTVMVSGGPASAAVTVRFP